MVKPLPTPTAIVSAACRACSVTHHDLATGSRIGGAVAARAIAVYLLGEIRGMSLAECATAIGARSHTTALSAKANAWKWTIAGRKFRIDDGDPKDFCALMARAHAEVRSV